MATSRNALAALANSRMALDQAEQAIKSDLLNLVFLHCQVGCLSSDELQRIQVKVFPELEELLASLRGTGDRCRRPTQNSLQVP
jgi:hypothetical protein